MSHPARHRRCPTGSPARFLEVGSAQGSRHGSGVGDLIGGDLGQASAESVPPEEVWRRCILRRWWCRRLPSLPFGRHPGSSAGWHRQPARRRSRRIARIDLSPGLAGGGHRGVARSESGGIVTGVVDASAGGESGDGGVQADLTDTSWRLAAKALTLARMVTMTSSMMLVWQHPCCQVVWESPTLSVSDPGRIL